MNRLFVRAGLLLGLGSLLALGSACSKEIEANFPRPPATAAVPPPEERMVPVTTEDTPRPSDDVATALPRVAAPVVEEPSPAEDNRPRRRAATPAPPVEADPAGPPPSTQLALSEELDAELVARLRRAERLLGVVDRRKLTRERQEQLIAARAFLSQARMALSEGDERRAVVLIDKGLILAEDVERASRP